jgi:hypothetical protein
MNEDQLNDHGGGHWLDPYSAANESMRELEESETEEGSESLPFGMSGVTGLLQRLSAGTDDAAWPLKKQRMVARYLLELSNVYWMNPDEQAFCQRVAAA